MLNQNELQSLLHILRDSFKAIFGEQFDRMILFGSRARGDHREDSDVDILVVLKGEFNDLAVMEQTSEFIARLSLESDVLISRKFISSDKFQHGRSPFLQNVAKEGVLI